MEPKKEVGIAQALESGLVQGKIRDALQEFWEWYDVKYAMPAVVEVADRLTIRIRYDITEAENACAKTCMEMWKNELLAEGYSEEEIETNCYRACRESIAEEIIASFSEVQYKLFKVLDKYGIRYDWEGSWEGNERYLWVYITS